MTNQEKLVTLIEQLVRKTDYRQLRWEQLAQRNGFVCGFENYSASIHEFYDENVEDSELYVLRLLDSEGNTIDAIHAEDFADFPEMAGELKRLYRIARANARGSDKALDEILSSLK